MVAKLVREDAAENEFSSATTQNNIHQNIDSIIPRSKHGQSDNLHNSEGKTI